MRKTQNTLRLAVGWGFVLMLLASQFAFATHDPFFLIKKTIVMHEIEQELPMPDYEYVDIKGAVKDPPAECPGGIDADPPVIATVSGDDCVLRPQLTFTDGYLDTNGTVFTPNAAVYNGGRSSVTIVGHVGDIVQLTVKNELPEAVNEEAIETGFYAPADNLQIVHWHGMELDNESDGTPVTEFGIEPGKQRLYQYRLYRPGNYWFHPHTSPLRTEHRGMVGKLIIRSWEEELLTLAGVLPFTYRAFQLSDTTVANEINKTKTRNNAFFDGFTQEEVDNNLIPDIQMDLTGDNVCDRGMGGDCIVPEGELVFVNDVVPTGDHNIPTVYVPKGRAARVAFINSSNERFYRFRLLEDGVEPPWGPAQGTRNNPNLGQCYAPGSSEKFSGADPLSCDQGLPMYRIGGQNGLLDRVRLEGQPELPEGEPARPFDTVIRTGEDFIGVAERTEFLVLTKDRDGNYLDVGEELFIWNIDYPHGAVSTFFDNNIGDGDVNNRDFHARKLVRIKVVPNILGLPNFDIDVDDPIMAHPLVNRPTEDIKSSVLAQLDDVPNALDPFLSVPFEGTTNPTIMLTNRLTDNSRFPSLNANKGEYDGFPINGTDVPTQDSVRYARVGDVVEFVYANGTNAAHHPFHMHGFSFQPISIHTFEAVDTNNDGIDDSAVLDEPPLHVFDYNEFVDVEVMQPQKALKYRMKMNDRFKIPDETKFNYFQLLAKFPYDQSQTYGGPGDIPNPHAEMGGGVGRWLFHCHILHHALLGMIADLCVAPEADADASGCKIFIDPDVYEPL